MRFILLIHLSALTLFSQSSPVSVSAGFKLGSPLNDPANPSPFTSSTQGRWTGGPAIELHLPYRFAVEFDALYRSNRSSFTAPFRFGTTVNPYINSGTQKDNVWDLPLLLKYRFHLGSLRPFVSAGYQWIHSTRETNSYYLCSGPLGSCQPADYPFFVDPRGGQYHSTSTTDGPAAGAGVEFKTRYVTIAPEVRVTRPANGYPRDTRATGMVGFTFGGRK